MVVSVTDIERVIAAPTAQLVVAAESLQPVLVMEPEEEVVESATDNVFDTKQLVDTLSTTDGLCAEVLEIDRKVPRRLVLRTDCCRGCCL